LTEAGYVGEDLPQAALEGGAKAAGE